MRSLFTLLTVMVLTVSFVSAQCPQSTDGTIHTLTAQDSLKIDWSFHTVPIPDFSIERIYTRTPRSSIKYSTTDGSPMRFWRLYYSQTAPHRYDTLLIDRVSFNPSQTSDFYKPILGLVDPANVTKGWTPVGWIRADLDPDGRLQRLWGQDALGIYWVWRESQPFPATVAPAGSVAREVIE
jgi:hypothetical protein